MIYTSGTGSRPKGVVHAQRNAWGRRPMYRDWYGIGANDVMLHSGAFNWSYTLGVALTDPWANGATTVLYNGPKDIQENRISKLRAGYRAGRELANASTVQNPVSEHGRA